MNQPVSSTGGVSIVSTVWAPPGGGYSRYGAGSSSYGPVGLKSGSGAQIGVTTTLASYEFDDENQLVSVTQGSDRRTTFVYDGKRRRRVTREEIKGSSGQWVLASETRYVDDGTRVIQERNINGVPPQGSKETWRRFAASRSGPSLQASGIFKRTASSR